MTSVNLDDTNNSGVSRSRPSGSPGLFSDSTGKTSTMRLMSFISLLTSIAFGFFTLQDPANGNVGQ